MKHKTNPAIAFKNIKAAAVNAWWYLQVQQTEGTYFSDRFKIK